MKHLQGSGDLAFRQVRRDAAWLKSYSSVRLDKGRPCLHVAKDSQHPKYCRIPSSSMVALALSSAVSLDHTAMLGVVRLWLPVTSGML